jgi:hypothetical protein
MRVGVALLLVALGGCRTEISPVVKTVEVPRARVVDVGCEAQDYQTSADVPSGAKNLGWLRVDRAETDEVTFAALREAVCQKGGNAFSQARWIREAGASVADAPVALEANAWAVAER